MSNYKNISILTETMEKEKTIDQLKIMNQSSNLLLNLQSIFTSKALKSDLDSLMARANLFKDQKISPFSFYSYLKDLALKHIRPGLDGSDESALSSRPGLEQKYPELMNFIGYLTKVNSLDSTKLFTELEDLNFEIKQSLSKTDEQKTLVKLSHNIDFLENFFNLKVSNEDLDYYLNNKESHKVGFFKDFLPKTLKRYNINTFIDYNPDLIDFHLQELEDFYKVVKERDIAMVTNSLSEIEKRSSKVSSLIAGGFHTKGITKLLKEKGYSYIVVSPYSKTDIDEENYHFLLSGRRKPIEELLKQLDLSKIITKASKTLRVPLAFDSALLTPELARIFGLSQAEVDHANIARRLGMVLAIVMDILEPAELEKHLQDLGLKEVTVKDVPGGTIVMLTFITQQVTYFKITESNVVLATEDEFNAGKAIEGVKPVEATIQLPKPIQQLIRITAPVKAQGKTIKEAIAFLISQHPKLQDELFQADGETLKSAIAVFLNGEIINDLDLPLNSNDGIRITFVVRGGSDDSPREELLQKITEAKKVLYRKRQQLLIVQAVQNMECASSRPMMEYLGLEGSWLPKTTPIIEALEAELEELEEQLRQLDAGTANLQAKTREDLKDDKLDAGTIELRDKLLALSEIEIDVLDNGTVNISDLKQRLAPYFTFLDLNTPEEQDDYLSKLNQLILERLKNLREQGIEFNLQNARKCTIIFGDKNHKHEKFDFSSPYGNHSSDSLVFIDVTSLGHIPQKLRSAESLVGLTHELAGHEATGIGENEQLEAILTNQDAQLMAKGRLGDVVITDEPSQLTGAFLGTVTQDSPLAIEIVSLRDKIPLAWRNASAQETANINHMLAIESIGDIDPHEVVNPANVRPVKESIEKSGVFFMPVTVTDYAIDTEMPGVVNFDGHNRVEAAQKAGLKALLVQNIPYFERHILLHRWLRIWTGIDSDEMQEIINRLNLVEVGDIHDLDLISKENHGPVFIYRQGKETKIFRVAKEPRDARDGFRPLNDLETELRNKGHFVEEALPSIDPDTIQGLIAKYNRPYFTFLMSEAMDMDVDGMPIGTLICVPPKVEKEDVIRTASDMKSALTPADRKRYALGWKSEAHNIGIRIVGLAVKTEFLKGGYNSDALTDMLQRDLKKVTWYLAQGVRIEGHTYPEEIAVPWVDKNVELEILDGNAIREFAYRNNVFSEIIEEKAAPARSLRETLAEIFSFYYVLKAIPLQLPMTKRESGLVNTFLRAVKGIGELTRGFEAQNPSFRAAHMNESLCIVNIDGKRILGYVKTPFEERRTVKEVDVLVFDPTSEDNYTQIKVDIVSLEFISNIFERLDKEDIFPLLLKFRPEYFDLPDGPGTARQRQVAKGLFLSYALNENTLRDILESDQLKGLVDELGENDYLRKRIEQLRKGVVDNMVLDDWFIETLQDKSHILQHLLYSGNATVFWYDLLVQFDQMRALLERSLNAVEKKRLYIENAYERAVVGLWLYRRAQDKDFDILERERGTEHTIQDFQLTLETSHLKVPGHGSGETALPESAVCLNCPLGSGPCSSGQWGSVGKQYLEEADIIDRILNLVEGGEATMPVRQRLSEEKIANVNAMARHSQIDEMELGSWLAMNDAELRKKSDSLRRKGHELLKIVRETPAPFCPLGVRISPIFNLLARGELLEAHRLLMEDSFLAGLFGKVCPWEHLCEAACTLGRQDGVPLPVDIGNLEFTIEHLVLKLYGKLPTPEVSPFNDKYVAIVGSGPAALQAAMVLRRAGYKVVIYEGLPEEEVGGVLAYGIPTFRLPPELLKEKIRILKELGVKFVASTLIGERGAYTIQELRKSFDAVIVAVGAGQAKKMELEGEIEILDEATKKARLVVLEGSKRRPVPGRELEGIISHYFSLYSVYSLKSHLEGYRTPVPLSLSVREAFKKSWDERGEDGIAKEVEVNIIIAGIGNVGFDCVRTMHRIINKENRKRRTRVKPNIMLLYRRPKKDLDLKARKQELEHLREEARKLNELGLGRVSIEDYELTQILEYIGENGRVRSIRVLKYDRDGSNEGVIVDFRDDLGIRVDEVVEALGSDSAAAEVGGLPLNEYGYARIANGYTMQVARMDSSDGLAPVYAAGDVAAINKENDKHGNKISVIGEDVKMVINPNIEGTAVGAAAMGNLAAKGIVTALEGKDGIPVSERPINVEEMFFADKKYADYEILEKRKLGTRTVIIEHGPEEQEIYEVTVFAPHVARRIKPGQFVTIMSDRYGEKVPITYVWRGDVEGSIRFAIMGIGESTRLINSIKQGEKFYAVTGPAGTPSIYSGLGGKGEVVLVGMGTGIAAIFGIAVSRARLDKKYKELIRNIGDETEKRSDEIVSLLGEIWEELRLEKPDIFNEIINAIREEDYALAKELLSELSHSLADDFSESRISQDIADLAGVIETLEKSIKDKEKLNLYVRQDVYPVLDRVWKELEVLVKARDLEEIKTFIAKDKYDAALERLKAIIGEGFTTKVFLAGRDKDTLIYRKELEQELGKDNIIIVLEDDKGFDAIAEGYEGRFYKGFAVKAFTEYIDQTMVRMSGLLVAGPPAGMVPFINAVRKSNRQDILTSARSALSADPFMSCIYGGCSGCIMKTLTALYTRGCLGPEVGFDEVILEDYFYARLKAGEPFKMPPVDELPLGSTLSQSELIDGITHALKGVIYLPTLDGKLFVAIQGDDGKASFVAELTEGGLSNAIARENLTDILNKIDWERLNITKDSEKIQYAYRLAKIGLGLSLGKAAAMLGISIQGGTGPAAPVQELSAGKRDATELLKLEVAGVGRIGEFSELTITPGSVEALLEIIGSNEQLDGLLKSKGNKFILVYDSKGKRIAVIVRNEAKQTERLWIREDASGDLFRYLMLRAGLASKNPFRVTVDDISEPGGPLGIGAIVPAAQVGHHNKGLWTTKKAQLNRNACTLCSLCTLVCPDAAIPLHQVAEALEQNFIIADPLEQFCTGCSHCVSVCPHQGYALRMVEKNDNDQAKPLLAALSQGRSVVVESELTPYFDNMFRNGALQELEQALGVTNLTVFSKSDKMLQMRYEVDDIAYLITIDKGINRLTVRSLMTFAVVGFGERDEAFIDALRDKGFGIVNILSIRDKDFKGMVQKARAKGLEVYTIEQLFAEKKQGLSRSLTELDKRKEYFGPLKVAALDMREIEVLLGLNGFTGFIDWVSGLTRDKIISPREHLLTGVKDIDEVFKAFAPPFYEQVRGYTSGHVLCPGCGHGEIMGLLSKVFNKSRDRIIPVFSMATGCLEVSSTKYEYNSFGDSAVHANYTASPSVAAGLYSVYLWIRKMAGRFWNKTLMVVNVFGDGALLIDANNRLSVLAKNTPIFNIFLDNGGTQNTGAQPTPVSLKGIFAPGVAGVKKTVGLDVSKFVRSSGANVYYAVLSTARPEDAMEKMRRLQRWVELGLGPGFAHVKADDCPTGWGANPELGQEEASLAVKTAVGAMVLHERVGDYVRISDEAMPPKRDGKVSINTRYLISLEYELKHLKDEDGRILTDDEVENILNYIRARRFYFLQRTLKESMSPGIALDTDMLADVSILDAFNMATPPVFEGRLQMILGLSNNEIEAVKREREKLPNQRFTDVAEILAFDFIDSSRYEAMRRRALEYADSSHDLDELIDALTESEEGHARVPLQNEKAFGAIEDINKIPGMDSDTFKRLKPYLKTEEGRPHVIEYLATQRRWREVMKPENAYLIEEMQRETDDEIEALIELHKKSESKAFFTELDRLLERDEPVDIERFKTVGEDGVIDIERAHRILFPAVEVPDDPGRADRIAMRGSKPVETLWFSRAGKGAITAVKFLVTYAGIAEGLDVQEAPEFDVARTGDIVKVSEILGPRVRTHTPVTEPDIIVLMEDSLITAPKFTQAITDIKPGGILLVNSAKSPEDIRKILEGNRIAAEKIRIFTLDASSIGKKHLGRDLPNMPMLAARILLSKFTELDLGDPEIAVKFMMQFLIKTFGQKVAEQNRKAMVEAINALQGSEAFIELQKQAVVMGKDHDESFKREPIDKRSALNVSCETTVMDANIAAATGASQAAIAAGQPLIVPMYPTTPATSAAEKMADLQKAGLPILTYLETAEDGIGGFLLGIALAGGWAWTSTTSVALTYMLNQHGPDMWGKLIPRRWRRAILEKIAAKLKQKLEKEMARTGSVVINVATRDINVGSLTIQPGDSDIAFFRDWAVILRARNSQEAYYYQFIGRLISIELGKPVIVAYTGFRNSHTEQKMLVFNDYEAIRKFFDVDEFTPDGTLIGPEVPRLSGPVTGTGETHELVGATLKEYELHGRNVIEGVFLRFEKIFGPKFGPFIEYRTDDAKELIIVQGDVGENIEEEVDRLREEGRNVGVIQVVSVRPFLAKRFGEILDRVKPDIVTVLSNDMSHFLYDDVVKALKGRATPLVFGPIVYGLGGRNFFTKDARVMFDTLRAFNAIRILGNKRGPVSLTKILLGQLQNEALGLNVEAAITYVKVSEALEGFSTPSRVFTAEELAQWQAGPKDDDIQSLKTWQVLQGKLNLQLRLIEKIKDGTYEPLDPGDPAKLILDSIAGTLSEDELAVYRRIAPHVEGRAGGRSIAVLMDLLDETSKRTDNQEISRDAITAKLTDIRAAGDYLRIFGMGEHDIYQYGLNERDNEHLLLHALLTEISIRLSRRTLNEKTTEGRTPTLNQTLQAATTLLDLSEIPEDRQIGAQALESLAQGEAGIIAEEARRRLSFVRVPALSSIAKMTVDAVPFLAGSIINKEAEFLNKVLPTRREGQIFAIIATESQYEKLSPYLAIFKAEKVQILVQGRDFTGQAEAELIKLPHDSNTVMDWRGFQIINMGTTVEGTYRNILNILTAL